MRLPQVSSRDRQYDGTNLCWLQAECNSEIRQMFKFLLEIVDAKGCEREPGSKRAF